MTTTTEARAPYVSIHVQLECPDAPMLNGRPVTTVSWNANRYSTGATSFTVYAHHPEDPATPDDHLTALLRTNSTEPPIVPDWCPRPPAGWLASLTATAKPDHIAAASAAIDQATMKPACIECGAYFGHVPSCSATTAAFHGAF